MSIKAKDCQNSLKVFAIIFVIAVIFLFCTFIFLDYINSRNRDRSRTESLKEVREALFYYYNENGYYPSSISDWDPESLDYGAEILTGAVDYDNLASLISDVIQDIPKDPLNIANSPAVSRLYIYRYVASSDGQNFAIVYETENKNDDSPMLMRGW